MADTSYLSLLRWTELAITFLGGVCIPIDILDQWRSEKMKRSSIFPSEAMLQRVVEFPGFPHGNCIESSQCNLSLVIQGKIAPRFYLGFLCHFSSQSKSSDDGSRILRLPNHPHPPLALILPLFNGACNQESWSHKAQVHILETLSDQEQFPGYSFLFYFAFRSSYSLSFAPTIHDFK